MSETMAWIWKSIPDDDQPWGEFDNGRSTFHSYFALSDKEEALDGRKAIFRFEYDSSDVLKYRSPANDSQIIIDDILKCSIEKYALNDRVQFYPVILECKDQSVLGYYFVIPLERLPCINVKNSEIISSVEGKNGLLIFKTGKLYHNRGCLGKRDIVRDSMSLQLVVSENLKNTILQEGGNPRHFIKIEEI